MHMHMHVRMCMCMHVCHPPNTHPPTLTPTHTHPLTPTRHRRASRGRSARVRQLGTVVHRSWHPVPPRLLAARRAWLRQVLHRRRHRRRARLVHSSVDDLDCWLRLGLRLRLKLGLGIRLRCRLGLGLGPGPGWAGAAIRDPSGAAIRDRRPSFPHLRLAPHFAVSHSGEIGYDICVLNLSDPGLTDDRLSHARSVTRATPVRQRPMAPRRPPPSRRRPATLRGQTATLYDGGCNTG